MGADLTKQSTYTKPTWLKRGCEVLRFFVSQRKTNSLESAAKRAEKVQNLAKRTEKPDKSDASYKA